MEGERKGHGDVLEEGSRKAESEIKRNGKAESESVRNRKAESEERNLEKQRQ